MPPYGTGDLVEIAKTLPVADLPHLIGICSEAIAVAQSRLLTLPPVQAVEPSRLIDRKEAAKALGISTYYLENKRIRDCETRIGRRVLYDAAKLARYVKQGHIPFEDRHK